MKAQDMAPVAWEAMVASALHIKSLARTSSHLSRGRHPRGLIIFAARQHDDICRRCLGGKGSRMGFLAIGGLLEETHDVAGNTAEITLTVR